MPLPELGVGIVFVPGLEPLLEPGSSAADVVEIEPQTLWHFSEGADNPYLFPADVLAYLEALPQKKIIHSVGFGVGGTKQAPAAGVESLAQAATVLNAPWVSEHLSFTHFDLDGEVVHAGFMLPPLQTVDGALAAARTIREFAAQLPVPFAVETGVNYLEPRAGEVPDGEFVALAVEHADCGILLDLHNIWTNERNGRQSVKDFLANIPLDRVWEIHLAGGFEFDGYWLDAHSGAIPGPVLEWAEELIPALPNLKAAIYEIFPSFVPFYGLDNIANQLSQIASIWSRRGGPAASRSAIRDRLRVGHPTAAPSGKETAAARWEDSLGGLVSGGRANGRLAQDLRKDKGVDLFRKLIWKFRASAIVKSLAMLTQLIRLHCGEKRLEQLLDGYFNETAPQAFASEEAKCFIHHLRGQELEVPYLAEIMLFEERSMQALLSGDAQYMLLDYDPRSLLDALAEGRIPERLEPGSFELELTP